MATTIFRLKYGAGAIDTMITNATIMDGSHSAEVKQITMEKDIFILKNTSNGISASIEIDFDGLWRVFIEKAFLSIELI